MIQPLLLLLPVCEINLDSRVTEGVGMVRVVGVDASGREVCVK